MAGWRSPRIAVFALGAAAAVVAMLILGLLFTASGVYNVAASRKHFAVSRWLIEFGLHRSVALHSRLVTAPPLDDPDLVQLGAGHYHGGCEPCHAGPGRRRSPALQAMLPAPPDLRIAVPSWTSEQLFWIVKHGLKFTGMPGWAAQGRDDEVWAVVAFLRELPGMDTARYRALALGNAEPVRRQGETIAKLGGGADNLTQCIRCHGDENSPPANRLIPSLAGQSQTYLALSMRFYANDLRPSGIMQPIAAELDDEAINDVVEYYASLPARRQDFEPPAGPPARIAQGRELATKGIPARGIPPCLTCHGAGRAKFFPQLAGQSAPYLAGQLRLWQQGLRDRTAPGAIMAAIARRLNAEQIADAAAYFESLPPQEPEPVRPDRDVTGRGP